MHPMNPADELSDESLNTIAGGQAASLMASASRAVKPGGTLGIGP